MELLLDKLSKSGPTTPSGGRLGIVGVTYLGIRFDLVTVGSNADGVRLSASISLLEISSFISLEVKLCYISPCITLVIILVIHFELTCAFCDHCSCF